MPKFEERKAEFDALNQLRAERIKEFMGSHRGYYRHLPSKHPQTVDYEADEEDLIFLAKNFPAPEFNHNVRVEEEAHHPLIKDFNSLVMFIEESKQYNEPVPKFTGAKLERPDAWEKVNAQGKTRKEMFVLYWRSKCSMIKRLLCRQFWRFADSQKPFGPAKKAFVPFEPRGDKPSRSNFFRKDEDLLNLFDDVKKEQELIHNFSSLTIIREELKLLKIQSEFLHAREPVETLKRMRDRLASLAQRAADAENKLRSKLDLPAPMPPVVNKPENEAAPPPGPTATPVQRPDNDWAAFVCSTIHQLEQVDSLFMYLTRPNRNFITFNKLVKQLKTSKGNLKIDRVVVANEKPQQRVVDDSQKCKLVKRISCTTLEPYVTKTPFQMLDDQAKLPVSTIIRKTGPLILPLAAANMLKISNEDAKRNSHLNRFKLENIKAKNMLTEECNIDSFKDVSTSAEDELSKMSFVERFNAFKETTNKK